MIKKAAIALFITSFALSSCAQKGIDKLEPIEDQSQSHIFFSSANYNLKKTKAEVSSNKDGWTEAAEWRNAQDGSFVYVYIFAHVSYNKVIMSSFKKSLEERIYESVDRDTVSLGSRDKIVTKAGFYEFQFLSASGIGCVYVQSYWGDKSFGGIDVVRGAEASDSIVGNHMLLAYFCDQQKSEMDNEDMSGFLLSINLRDAFWPADRFESIE